MEKYFRFYFHFARTPNLVGGIASRFGGRRPTNREYPCEHSLDPDRFRSRSAHPRMAPARQRIAGTMEERAPKTHQTRNKGGPTTQQLQKTPHAEPHRHPKPTGLGVGVLLWTCCVDWQKRAMNHRTGAGQEPNKCRTNSEQKRKYVRHAPKTGASPVL